MWRLSDELVKEAERTMREIYDTAKKHAECLADQLRWLELPESEKCIAFGVDGSKGEDKRSGVVIYAVSGIAAGKTILELHDVAVMKSYKHIDERIRLHMTIMEFRVGAMIEEADIILFDGTLSGDLIRPPTYIDSTSRDVVKRYEFENLLDDFIEKLDDWWTELQESVKGGKTQRTTLLSRTKFFDELERKYRKDKEGHKDNLRILLEYVEYLQAFDVLLDKDIPIVSIAKTFYKDEFAPPGICDYPILDLLAYRQLGKRKAAYLPFEYTKVDKRIPKFAKKFANVSKLLDRLYACYIRFTDSGNIYLLESNHKVNDDLMAKIVGLELEGYLLPLKQAHNLVKIKKKEMDVIVASILNALAKNPEFSILLRSGRAPLERVW